ncbi:hypothetical protein [Rhodococcoides fascians]|uniref:hypothetical protein n=1 Tax=Rhodococcoides fascians TaxID=1828 RepID=UPI0027800B89|nr:hypothetical protein [Rhodococcus fascians]MDQ0284115.1 hypothetical protein [Rhodococcus fascians]
MRGDGWEFWSVTRATDGTLDWLAATKPGARSAIDRRKVWTLLPGQNVFLANWLVTEDLHNDETKWMYENIDADEARSVAIDVPEVAAELLARLTRPEAELTLQQIDRYPVEKLLGKRTSEMFKARLRTSS